MTANVIELLNRYGDREFGEEWWPRDARAWLDPEKAAALSDALLAPSGDSLEACALMTEYGETKFGPKWRPWEAEAVLGRDEAEALAGYLGELGAAVDCAVSPRPGA